MNDLTVAQILAEPLSDAAAKNLWYDWFCHERYLVSKARKLTRLLGQISRTDLFDPQSTGVFFKNNCPAANGMPLYDSIHIVNQERDPMFYVAPLDPWSKSSEVHGFINQWKEPLVQGSWSAVKKFFAKTKL